MKRPAYLLGYFLTILSNQRLFAQEGDNMPFMDQGLWQTLAMIGIAIAFFYFILWRPEQKRRKALEEQRSNLKKGDKVTAMGILGTVLRVEEQTVILKLYDGAKMEVLKGAVTDVAPPTGPEEEKHDE
ncbi:MAG: preprotein translocase subunit YajC [Waddliaceae bacterium]